MNATDNRDYLAKLDLSRHKLFVSGAIASLGAPVVFVVYLAIATIYAGENLLLESVLSLSLVVFIVSISLTMVLTLITYLVSKFRSKKSVNIGLVTCISIPVFFILALVVTESMFGAFFYTCFALINAIVFMFLAHRQSIKSELSL